MKTPILSRFLKHLSPALAAVTVTVIVSGLHLQAQTTIYSDSFTGSSSNSLSGTVPGTSSGTFGGTLGATWDSYSNYNADGSITPLGTGGGASSAALPFTPQSGLLYTLSATVNNTSTGSTAWLSLGFEQNDDIENSQASFSNVGYGWMLERGTRGAGQGEYFAGPGNSGPGSSFFDNSTGALTYTVQLDTSAANWTVQDFLNGTPLDSPYAYSTNPTINYVGVSAVDEAGGNVGSFSLTATPAPEPSACLSMVGGLGMLLGFRRRRG